MNPGVLANAVEQYDIFMYIDTHYIRSILEMGVCELGAGLLSQNYVNLSLSLVSHWLAGMVAHDHCPMYHVHVEHWLSQLTKLV